MKYFKENKFLRKSRDAWQWQTLGGGGAKFSICIRGFWCLFEAVRYMNLSEYGSLDYCI
jgi:hypothetical protein